MVLQPHLAALPPDARVSCILPTFDRRLFVPVALACFERQDYPNRELIVLDDGCHPVEDLVAGRSRVRYVRLTKRATIGAKRNLAAELARGEVLMQWDDDDWFGPTRIRDQLGVLLAGAADLCHLEQRWLFDACSGRFLYRYDESQADARVASGTLAMTKATWVRAGGYMDSSDAEDWELFQRAVARGARAALVANEGSYVYVRHGGNSYRILIENGLPPTGWAVRSAPPTIPGEDRSFYESLASRLRAGRPKRAPSQVVDLAIVHHANQYLITDGYLDHEGLSDLLDAFSAVLRLHLGYEVPVNLHLSGTLIEAIAWHRPSFFRLVRDLAETELLELIGSAYSQNVMPLFSREHNRRQLIEAFGLYERHLGVAPDDVRGFWVPERVWDEATFSELLTDDTLPNGGYEWVLLDDRVRFPSSQQNGATCRRQFDEAVSGWISDGLCELSERYAEMVVSACSPFRPGPPRSLPPLTVVPMFSPFRYWIPPGDARRRALLQQGLKQLAQLGAPLAVFGDDLERTAGVGPWSGESAAAAIAAFETFLAAISQGDLPARAATISKQLRRTSVPTTESTEPGTFFELAVGMGAGEDYRAWWDAPDWGLGRSQLERTAHVLRGRAGGLWELAWKQLLASSYETGWRDWDGTKYRPTPWAWAHASHSRSALLAAAAAEWQQMGSHDGGFSIQDVDEDGDEELVLASERLYVVITPRYGGRIVAMFDLAAPGGGALVVGNPADHWNLQVELNRFMEHPRSHPGGFCDAGFENDRYDIDQISDGTAFLRNVERSSRMFGATKQLRLHERRAIEATYTLPPAVAAMDVEFALSPNYLALLRGGVRELNRVDRHERSAWRVGSCEVWVAADPEGRAERWRESLQACPHAVLVTYKACGPSFTVRLGVGTREPHLSETEFR